MKNIKQLAIPCRIHEQKAFDESTQQLAVWAENLDSGFLRVHSNAKVATRMVL